MAKAEPRKQEEPEGKPFDSLAQTFGRRQPPPFFMSSIILLLLAEAPAHGYALFKDMCELGIFDETMEPSAIYPTLKVLNAGGLIDSQVVDEGAGPPRKVFHITGSGSTALAGLSEHLEDMSAGIEYFQHRYQGVATKRKGRKPGTA